MRRYWLPGADVVGTGVTAAAAPDAARREADRLRDSAGRVGVMDQRCPPLRLAVPRPQRGRRHPLPLSRLEYDVEATASTCRACPRIRISHRVKARAYRTVERAALSGSIGRAPRRRRCLASGARPARARSMSADPATATGPGIRRRAHFYFAPAWRPRRPRTCRRTSRSTTPSPTAPRSTTCRRPWGTQYAGYRSAGPGYLRAL